MNIKFLRVKAILLAFMAGLIGCTNELYDDGENSIEMDVSVVKGEYIDISPEVIERGDIYMDTKSVNRYIEALGRFHSHVKIKNGEIVYCGVDAEKLNISDQLFAVFQSSLNKTNDMISCGDLVLLEGTNGEYELIAPSRKKLSRNIKMLKTRSETDPTFNPGRLDGDGQSCGETVLDGMRQFFKNVKEDLPYGHLGDYVDLGSYSYWSQGNATMSGDFYYGENQYRRRCTFTIVNMNAAMNGTGYNELCTFDTYVNQRDHIYEIYVTGCQNSVRSMVIRTYDELTYSSLLEDLDVF